jgi:hypothetical protein
LRIGGYDLTFEDECAFFAVFLARFQNNQGGNLIVVRQENDSIAVDGQFLSRLFDAPLCDADPIKRDPPAKKMELDAARDRAELAMAKDITQFRHPNDLVTLAVADLGAPVNFLQTI